jgi:DNA polymerase V
VGEKLRAGRLLAAHVSVFVETNPFSATQPQYNAGAQTTLLQPTNQTSVLIAAALDLLRSIYRVGYQYKKTGLFVTAMSPEGAVQLSLFEEREDKPVAQGLSVIVDQLNRKLGANTVRYGSMGTRDTWAMRQNRRSRKFTTRWSELPVAKA